jgi:hypothetical protein
MILCPVELLGCSTQGIITAYQATRLSTKMKFKSTTTSIMFTSISLLTSGSMTQKRQQNKCLMRTQESTGFAHYSVEESQKGSSITLKLTVLSTLKSGKSESIDLVTKRKELSNIIFMVEMSLCLNTLKVAVLLLLMSSAKTKMACLNVT